MTRYSPNAFKYNDRVAVALLPSLVILGSYAGQLVSGILMAGAMFTYIMDTLRWREAAFVSVWITLVASNVGFIISTIFQKNNSVLLLFGSFGLNGSTLMLTGLWATIQFKWMLIQYPELVLPIERLLLASALPIAMTILSWGLSGAIGMNLVPFPAMAVGCCLYALCVQPLPSSFQRTHRGPGIGGAVVPMSRVQGRFEGVMSMVAVCVFPALMYLTSHLEVIFEAEHFWSLHLLWSLPALFICLLPEGLWWVSENAILVQYLRAGIAAVAGVVALFGVEGRVIFHSFATYIPLDFPYNWIVVSTFLALNGVLVGAHFSGLLQSQVGFTVGSCLLVVSACAGGIAVGLPLMLMPAPLIGSAGFALFYESGLLRDYLVFFAGTIATFTWLLWHHFWFLDIFVDNYSMHFICQLIAVGAVVALIVPGLLITDTFDVVTKRGLEAFLAAQALAVTLLEEHLFAGEHDDEVTLYPAYLVLLTSVVGIWFSRTLSSNGYISEIVGWLLQCVYISKLSMVLLPQARLVPASLCVVLAVSPPVLLMKPGREPLHPWKGGLLAASVVVSVVLARMAIFDIVQALISAHPPEGLLLGTLVLVAAAGCAPLFYRFYSHSQPARRTISLAVAFGTLLCFLRPPLPIVGTSKCPNLPGALCPRLWDERHIPDHEVDDLEMYGMGWTRREHWPLWLLTAAVMTGLAAVTAGPPVQRSVHSRLLWGALGGLCVGTYLGLEFFPDQNALQILCIVSAVAGCGLLVLIQQPSGFGQSWMPLLVAAWAALFLVMFIFQAEQPLPPASPGTYRLFPDTPRMMEAERREAGRAAVLAIYAAQSLLIAFALKLKVGRALRSSSSNVPGTSGSSWDPRMHGYAGFLSTASPSFRAFCGPGGLGAMFSTMVSPKVFDRMAGMMKMSGAGGLMLRRLSIEGLSWVPTVGNLITMFSFMLCVCLNSYFTNGAGIGICAVCPILLLLSQDPIMFRDLAEKRRYFPVAVALIACLWMSSLSDIVNDSFSEPIEAPVGFVVRNFVGLLASLPSLLSFLGFLWIHDQLGNSMYALTLLPLNLVPLLVADIPVVQGLGVLGLSASVVLAAVYSKLRNIGQRLI